MTADRQRFIRSVFQKLEINFRISHRINKNPNAVLRKTYYWICFIIFPRKGKPSLILNNGFRSTHIVSRFCVLYSQKCHADIYNVPVGIFSYVVVTHSCASRLIVRCYTNAFGITVTFSIIRKSFSVQVITSKGFIG